MHRTTRRVRFGARVARGAVAGDCTVEDGPQQRVSVGNLLGQDGRWLAGGHVHGLLETGRSWGRPALLCVRLQHLLGRGPLRFNFQGIFILGTNFGI